VKAVIRLFTAKCGEAFGESPEALLLGQAVSHKIPCRVLIVVRGIRCNQFRKMRDERE
jgi:hypothetical protein